MGIGKVNLALCKIIRGIIYEMQSCLQGGCWLPALMLQDSPEFGGKNYRLQPNLKQQSCQPVRHFALAKIEKTGSSTLYTVFARFVRNNKLNILVQTTKAKSRIDWRVPRHKGKPSVVIKDTCTIVFWLLKTIKLIYSRVYKPFRFQIVQTTVTTNVEVGKQSFIKYFMSQHAPCCLRKNPLISTDITWFKCNRNTRLHLNFHRLLKSHHVPDIPDSLQRVSRHFFGVAFQPYNMIL